MIPDLQMGPLHGDAYIGNLLREPSGRIVTSVITDLCNPEIAKIHAHRLSTLRSGANDLWHRYK